MAAKPSRRKKVRWKWERKDDKCKGIAPCFATVHLIYRQRSECVLSSKCVVLVHFSILSSRVWKLSHSDRRKSFCVSLLPSNFSIEIYSAFIPSLLLKEDKDKLHPKSLILCTKHAMQVVPISQCVFRRLSHCNDILDTSVVLACLLISLFHLLYELLLLLTLRCLVVQSFKLVAFACLSKRWQGLPFKLFINSRRALILPQKTSLSLSVYLFPGKLGFLVQRARILATKCAGTCTHEYLS